MDHSKVENKLEAFFDKELPEKEMGEIAAHAETCMSCREALQELGKVRVAFLQPSETKLSDAFAFKVLETIEAIEARESFNLTSFFRWLIPSISLPAAALILIAVMPLGAEESFPVQTSETLFPAAEIASLPAGGDSDWMGLEAL